MIVAVAHPQLVIGTSFVVFLVAAAVVLRAVLVAYGKVGPHRDLEAWSVRGEDARDEHRRVRAQVTALRVEAETLRREYVPPKRQEARQDG